MAGRRAHPEMIETYATSRTEWGRWGSSDEIGRANLLDPACVLRAAGEIQNGRRFSLALPLDSAGGDPNMPGRPALEHVISHDARNYADGTSRPGPGGIQHIDDWLGLSCHGTTHMDALGHTFAGGRLWNGFEASTAAGDGLRHVDIAALAEKGIVGRAVLVDLPAAAGKPHLDMAEEIGLATITAALERQGTTLFPGDTLILRTGIFKVFYEEGAASFYDNLDEPGVRYEPELVEFIADAQIAGLGSDTMSNERPYSDVLKADYPLHILLQRNLGVIFHESLWLEPWAADSAADGRYSAFYVAAPLRLRRGSASPMNPIVIK